MEKENQTEENLVKKTCRELNVNQKELAQMMKISQNSVSSWKNEKQKIPRWAERMFELLKTEKEHIELTRTIKRYKI